MSTIKTHKPDGEVSARLIHKAAGHELEASRGLLEAHLRRLCKARGHTVSSSAELMERLTVARGLFPKAQFSKLDLVDFYISGERDKLV